MATTETRTAQVAKALTEATGLLRGPQRVVPLLEKLISDKLRVSFEQRHLYSYTSTKRSSEETLRALLRWMLNAQRRDGGIAAYYSLLTGYSESYPEVTGYIVPTLYDLARATGDDALYSSGGTRNAMVAFSANTNRRFSRRTARSERAGICFQYRADLQGLVRAHAETRRSRDFASGSLCRRLAGQDAAADGSWSGPGAYQARAHTYYSMVAWSLAELSARTGDDKYGNAAERNLDWVLSHLRPSGWFDGINLRGHPNYLHFIAYVLQGVLECGRLRRRDDAVQKVAKSAWVLLRKFENNKYLPGAYETDFKARRAIRMSNRQRSDVMRVAALV